jgi:hypothetical protein
MIFDVLTPIGEATEADAKMPSVHRPAANESKKLEINAFIFVSPPFKM